MEETAIKNLTTAEPVLPGEEKIIVNQIQIRSADRTRTDIGDFKSIKITAESVYQPNRARLYDLFKTVVEEDGHLWGVITKRTDTVLNKRIYYRDSKGKRLEAFDKLCKSKEFRKARRNILATQYWGITGMEFIPGKVFRFKDIPRKHIKPKWGIISEQQNDITGVSYIGVPNLWIIGEPDDLGLYLKCAPYTILKKDNLADWGQFIEIFGQPIRVIKYDAFDRQAKVELQEVVDEAGTSLALLIPKTADFEIMDGKTSNANGDLQSKFHKELNDEIDVCLLGNTETTGNNNGGSNAKAGIQHKDQQEITKSDMDYLLGYLNDEQFAAILKSYGYPVVEGGEFVLEEEKDLEKVGKQLGFVERAKKMGIPVSDDYVYELTGIPKPNDYAQQKAKMEEQQQQQRAAKQPQAPPDPKPKPTPNKQKEGRNLSDQVVDRWIDRLRMRLADFFDRPR